MDRKRRSSYSAKTLDKEVPMVDEEYWDDDEADACDGITILKLWPVPGSKGKTKLYPGKVTYLRDEEKPYCFKVEYEDDEETMCLHEVVSLKKAPKSSKAVKKATEKAPPKPLAVKKTPMKAKAAKK